MTSVKRLALSASALAALSAPAGPASAQSAIEPFIGQTVWVSFNFCPRGWAPANGQLLAISQNQALFSLLGTTFGGNGTTTFALPDLRGRQQVGAGQGPGLSNVIIGERAGAETLTLTVQNLPAHTHGGAPTATLGASSAQGTSAAPAGNVLADGRTARIYRSGLADTPMDASSLSVSASTSSTGNGQPVANVAPYATLTACIALQGIFPSRN